MFNDIYSVDAGNGKHFAVKIGTLCTEVMIKMFVNGEKRWCKVMLCEMSDEFRALVLELNDLQRKGN